MTDRTPDEQYTEVCKDQFETIIGKLDGLQKRLYVDNGAESVQSKLNRHDRWIKIWGFLAVGIGGLVFAMAKHILEAVF